jgi:hypothetical protein
LGLSGGGERRDKHQRTTRHEQRPQCRSFHGFPPCFVVATKVTA